MTTRRVRMNIKTKNRIFNLINHGFLSLALVIVLVPLLHMVAASFSDPTAVTGGRVGIFPVDFTILGYQTIFEDKEIWIGYRNTVLYTVTGTALSTVLTMLAAYPLSRTDFKPRNFFMKLFTFTMFFAGGLIPTYLLVKNLKLLDTMGAIILPGAVSAYNIILARTFIQSNVPRELLEATQIDGCDDFRFFRMFVIPLTKPIIAVVSLFCAVGIWGSYFSAMIYLSNPKLYPLQIYLRDILISNQVNANTLAQGMAGAESMAAKQSIQELLKYSLIIVSSVPVLCIYPFIQKYFVRGVMLGSIKG